MTDTKIREQIFPRAIIKTTGPIAGAEIFLTPTDLQIGLDETHLVQVGGKASVILDFGKEINGSVRILTQTVDGGSVKVRISTGESLTECCAQIGEKNAGNHHTLRDITTDLIMYSDMSFLETGFRFLKLDILEDKKVTLKSVSAVYIHRDLKADGYFICSDKRVNDIFETARHTLSLNMQDYIWDGIKRDRLVWIGDLHPEMLGILSLYSGDDSIEKALTYSKNHTPLPGFINRTTSYTAWWIIILHDYWLHTGNNVFLKENAEYAYGCIGLLDTLVNDDGSILVEERCLFDWPSHGSEDEAAGICALFLLAARKAAAIFKFLNMSAAACEKLIGKLNKKSYVVLKWKQCEAFQVYAGLKDAEKSAAFLTADGGRGFSTFMSYYILSAISDGAGAQKAVELMKEYYGGMLDMGATSFWEDFDLDWTKNACPLDRFPEKGEADIHGDFGKHCYIGFRHSLCHGWSCGPVAFLIKKICGIEELEPCCAKMSISPQAAGFEWYESAYPTPHGLIKVSYKNGKFDISVPDGIEIVEPNIFEAEGAVK